MSEIDVGLPDQDNGNDTAMGQAHVFPRSTRILFNDTSADDEWVNESHESSSTSSSDDDRDDGSRVLAGLPLVPSAGGHSTDPISAVPRRVTASLTSLRSTYQPARRRARHFSPISKRLSRSEPHTEGLEIRHWLQNGPSSRGEGIPPAGTAGNPQSNHSRIVEFVPAVSPRDGDPSNTKDSHMSIEPVEVGAHGDSGRSRASSEDFDRKSDSGQNDLHVRRLTKHAERLRAKRTRVSDLIDSLRYLRVYARQRRKEHNNAELAFLNAAQEQLSAHPSLLALLGRMRQAHDEQLEVELRIDEVVEDLHQAEVLLDIRERIFFSAASGANVSFADADTESGESGDSGDSNRTTGRARRRRQQELAKKMPYVLTGISGRRPADLHPTLSKLQSVVRELRLSEEHLANLDARKDHLDGVVKSWEALNHSKLRRFAENANSLATLESKSARTLTKDEINFLHTYDGDASAVSSEIVRLRNEIARLQFECRTRGIISKDELLPGEQANHNGPDIEEIDLEDISRAQATSGSSPLRHPRFPLLLTNPMSLLEDEPKTPQQALRNALALPRTDPSRQRKINDSLRERNIDMLLRGPEPKVTAKEPDIMSEQNVQKFVQDSARQGMNWKSSGWVNRWLLHKLQLSVLEATTFYNTTLQYHQVRQLMHWQISVLQFWPKDAAGGLTHESTRSTTGSSVAIYFRSSSFPISRRRSESDLPTILPSASRSASQHI